MNRKIIATLVGTALITGCNSSDSDKDINKGSLAFTYEKETNDGYDLCRVPNLEVLIHDLQGNLVDSVATDETGQLSLSAIPNNHYFTVNPDQDGFEPTHLRIESIQKELVRNGNQIEVYRYNGEVIDCEPVEDGSNYQKYDVVTDIETLVTIPSHWNNTIEVDEDYPGIFAFSCSDQYCEDEVYGYTYIQSSEFEGQDEIVINAAMLKPLDKTVEVTVKPLLSDTVVGWIVSGKEFYTDFYISNGLTNTPQAVALPEEVEHLALDTSSVEHVLLNGFAYATFGQYSVNNDITVERIAADSFVFGDFDGATLNFELNNFSADLVYAYKEYYEDNGSIDIEHSVYAKDVTNSVTIPAILSDVDADMVSMISLLEVDGASRVSIDNLSEIGGKAITPIWKGVDVPEWPFK
ncbi:hypothetical protein [Vibrio sp. WXL103]|uniref:hypothetical protein n=1 Tax=Vibrio sp. WXL103 TaxID=3450710 RepID=UPI003EC84C17